MMEIHIVSTGARCDNDHMVTAFSDRGKANDFVDRFPDCYVDSILVDDPHVDSLQLVDGYTCTINIGKNATVFGDKGKYVIDNPDGISKDGDLIQLFLTVLKPEFFDEGIVVHESRLNCASITAVSMISNVHAKKAVQGARRRFLKMDNKWFDCHRVDHKVEL